MSMKLLPASVNPVDPSQGSDVSTSLVPLAQRAVTTQAGQIRLVPSADTFAWSSGTRQGGVNCIDATPVEDSQSNEAGGSGWEYVSGWAWSSPVERMVVAHYLSYAAGSASGRGQIINLYA